MKEYIATIYRTINQKRTITIFAEDEDQAEKEALMVSSDDKGWENTDYTTTSTIDIDEVPNPYIDEKGNPYTDESWPAGGGLHRDCEFNADALYAYYMVGDRYKIADYLNSKHFIRIKCWNDREEWIKGNTKIIYEGYANGLWGYMHTELIK